MRSRWESRLAMQPRSIAMRRESSMLPLHRSDGWSPCSPCSMQTIRDWFPTLTSLACTPMPRYAKRRFEDLRSTTTPPSRRRCSVLMRILLRTRSGWRWARFARASHRAVALLEAIEAKQIAGTDLTADLVRQLQFLKNKEIDSLLESVWGTARESAADKLAMIEEYTNVDRVDLASETGPRIGPSDVRQNMHEVPHALRRRIQNRIRT